MLALRNVSLTFSEPQGTMPDSGNSSLRQITGTLNGDYVSRG